MLIDQLEEAYLIGENLVVYLKDLIRKEDAYVNVETAVDSVTSDCKYLYIVYTNQRLQYGDIASKVQGQEVDKGIYLYYIYGQHVSSFYNIINNKKLGFQFDYYSGEGLEHIDLAYVNIEHFLHYDTLESSSLKKILIDNNYLILVFDQEVGDTYRGLATEEVGDEKMIRIDLGCVDRLRKHRKMIIKDSTATA